MTSGADGDAARNSTRPQTSLWVTPLGAAFRVRYSLRLCRCAGKPLESGRCSHAEMTDCDFGYVQELAQGYLEHVLQAAPPGAQPSRVAGLLRDVASAVQQEVERSLQPCLAGLDVQSVDAARTLFRAVMQMEFEDGVVNWGRIVTVFAFEGILVKKLLGERRAADEDVEAFREISHEVAEFITKHTGEWIRQNGGWVSRLRSLFKMGLYSSPDNICIYLRNIDIYTLYMCIYTHTQYFQEHL